MNNITYIDPQYEIVIGSSLYEKVNGSDAYFDEFRISNITRNPINSYNQGMSGNPLSADGNTTILFHFENSILDEQRDERTQVTTKTYYNISNNFPIRLPPCSISLVTLKNCSIVKILLTPSNEEDGSNKGKQMNSYSNFVIIGLGTIIIVAGIVLIVIISKKRKGR